MPGLLDLDPGLLQAHPRTVGDGTDGHQTVRATDDPSVRERHLDPVPHPFGGLGAGACHDVHTAPPEHVLQDCGGVGVLARQDTVTAGHERDARPERLIGAA